MSDLKETIATLRAGGVRHAEFHENGTVKVLTLGPEDMPPEETGEAEPARVNPLREMASRLAYGPRKTANE